MKRQAMIVALGGLLAFVAALGLGSWGPAWTLMRDLRVPQVVPARLYHRDGLANPPDVPYGLLDPQPASDGAVWRFTDGHATLTFPYAAAAGRYSTVRMRLAGAPPAGRPPLTVTLRLNEQPIATFTAGAAYAVYTATLDTQAFPSPYLHPSDIQLDISSNTVTDPQTGQARGVAVAEVQLTQARSPTEIGAEAALWALVLMAVLAVALTRLPLRWALGYGGAALLTCAALHWTYAPRAVSLLVEIPLAGGAWLAAVGLAPARRPVLGLLIAAAGLWLVIAGRVLGDWEVDDAYISYRYADNLRHGAGLVYNPGEIVEGCTNFLWTLWIAAGLALGLDPAGLALASTIAAALGLLALTYQVGAKLAGTGSPWSLWSVAVLAVDTGVLTYGARGGGLETLPFTVAILLPVALLWGGSARNALRWRIAGGVALAAAALLRPEGIIVAAILLGGRAVQDGCAGRPVRRLCAAGTLPFAAIWLPYQVWRVGFYGYPFPNTFYAKTGASLAVLERGLLYADNAATDHWLLTALLLVGSLGLAWIGLRALRAGRRPAVSAAGRALADSATGLRVVLAALVCVYTLYIVIAGGDWAEAGRFFVPILAPSVLLAAEVLRWAGNRAWAIPRAGRAAPLALAGLTLIYLLTTLWHSRPAGEITTRLERETYKYQKWALAAIWLRDHTPPGTLLAATPAGVMAYYSRCPVVDMLGLNDLHIGHLQPATLGNAMAGHDKGDPAYVLARRPTYLLDYEEWYFAADPAALSRQYAVETVRTASGYPIRLLHRR